MRKGVSGWDGRREREIVRRLCGWFEANARELPWRRVGADGRRDAYRSLVSEFMLQQTQVSRVCEYFGAFLERFPTVADLAGAELGSVLEAWAGLGYYRRARHLHAAAKMIVAEFGGEVPRDVESLMRLPGVGRYTAGAIASMVFGDAAPLVDGNVARVLLRVEGKEIEAAAGLKWAWTRAEGLVSRAARARGCSAGVFNEGLMELGAVVCTPAAPACEGCPLGGVCEARRLGAQGRIPRPKARPERSGVVHSSVILRDGAGKVLVERRPEKGLWAGMWQAPTLESRRRPSPKKVAAWLGVKSVRRVGGFVHQTTHRSVEFVVWDGGVVGESAGVEGRKWVASMEGLALGNAQRRVLAMAAGEAG